MGVVRRYIDILTIIINFLYSTCISSFFGSSIPTSLFIFKMFFRSCFCYFLQYIATLLKEHSRSFKKNRDYANIIASGASFLVCSIARAVYIYIYIYI